MRTFSDGQVSLLPQGLCTTDLQGLLPRRRRALVSEMHQGVNARTCLTATELDISYQKSVGMLFA